MRKFFLLLLLSFSTCFLYAIDYTVRGRVIEQQSRQPVMDAYVWLAGKDTLRTMTDSLGCFTLEQVPPGIFHFMVTCIGYEPVRTSEYQISATTPFIEIELKEDTRFIQDVTVRPDLFRRSTESPVSMNVISTREIEKSPGSNRDVSRIVRNYPGVSFSPIGYRNDLIVRGGGPSENRFFMDGIEIPNINHFATLGASGGPVSIVNADLIRDINFYTGAFPAARAGAMSSVLDFRLRDGDPEKQTFKATLGASEVSLSGSGHFTDRTTYLFSVRQSYLQMLFKLLGLPFLPNYIDGQVKIKSRLKNNDELMFMALTGVDRMKLNTDEDGEMAQYMLSYLPEINQETFTVGATYKHYAGSHVQTYTLSHNYLNNRNLKFVNNDASRPENKTLDLKAVEQKTTAKVENRSFAGSWTLKEGVELNNYLYDNNTFQRLYQQQSQENLYETALDLLAWGLYVSGDYAPADSKFSASAGIRFDGNNYSPKMLRLWNQVSPRASMRYAFNPHWSLGLSAGWYAQLPSFSALGFKNTEGDYVNKALDYMHVAQSALGVEWRMNQNFSLSVEGFYKYYTDIPLSVADGIPLACKGADYGSVGNEALVSEARGRAYGVEVLFRYSIPERLNLTASFTAYKSEYQASPGEEYIASAWDNRYILNVGGTYDFPKQWSLGMRCSVIGGAPYTPYDLEKSELVSAWDVSGRPYLDYDRYNSERYSSFAQVDLRLDKDFYFKKWRLGFYIDIQNVFNSSLKQPDAWISTGEIVNPDAPKEEQRYRLKPIKMESGNLVPTLGLTVEF